MKPCKKYTRRKINNEIISGSVGLSVFMFHFFRESYQRHFYCYYLRIVTDTLGTD
jgi:hypothetical protein